MWVKLSVVEPIDPDTDIAVDLDTDAEKIGDRFDVVVVGGGIAGLTAAWRLRHRRILLLEADDRVGGRIRSESHGEYWLNYGAHLFPAPGSLLDSLAVEVGLHCVPVWGSMMGLAVGDRTLSSGPVESYPFRLGIPFRDRAAFARQGLRIRRAVRRHATVARARPGEQPSDTRRRLLAHEDDRTFAELLGDMPDRVEQIFACAAHRATAELDELSAGCGVGLFALVWGGKGSLIARNLIGGTGLLPEEMANRLGEQVRVASPVRSIRTDGDDLTVYFDDRGEPRSVRARHVVCAAPAPIAATLVADVATAAARSLRQLRYGPFLSVALATNEQRSMSWDGIYAMAAPGKAFDMFTNQAHVLRGAGPRRPGGSLMLFAGGHSAATLAELPDEQIVGRFVDDLERVFPGGAGVVEEGRVQRWPLGNVFAEPGRRHLQPPLEGALGPGRNLHLAGDYFAELGNMESAARTGAEAAARIDLMLDGPGRHEPDQHQADHHSGATS